MLTHCVISDKAPFLSVSVRYKIHQQVIGD